MIQEIKNNKEREDIITIDDSVGYSNSNVSSHAREDLSSKSKTLFIADIAISILAILCLLAFINTITVLWVGVVVSTVALSSIIITIIRIYKSLQIH